MMNLNQSFSCPTSDTMSNLLAGVKMLYSNKIAQSVFLLFTHAT